MASYFRVKRRHDEEPSNVLLIACKKSKTTENEEAESASNDEPVTAVVKFAGTITEHDEDSFKRMAQAVKRIELKENFKKHLVDVKNMLRTQIANNSIQNRYKIVSYYRSKNESNADESENNMTVIDIEDSTPCSCECSSVAVDENDSEAVNNYVYDLYYTEHGTINIDDDVLVYLQGIEEELVYDIEENDEPEYSSDSNSESRWNDYPDTDNEENEENEGEDGEDNYDNNDDDDDDDVDVDYLTKDVHRCHINDDNELDSDSSIDDIIYTIDLKDVELYGYDYARYKARTKTNFAMGNYRHNDELQFAFEDIDETISGDEANNSTSLHDT
ncbi:PREDICTED: probable RNA polymerase II nuclear localization protein SLC7A6OS [Polistes dominula]|uniref:Probable RNA polymerase II nuclear localization protein SLC7A6OS n=1 Tax=Polistes dominula TaxID=743375 RepID=A0ABM1INW2_POLDO|nr:PREDICTED: probable RNA polymerase II nuclear localization protein SLC7A6OS [Polistes dominula]